MKRVTEDSEPVRDIVDESEIDAVAAPRLSKGYWISIVEHADLLLPHKVLRLFFRTGRVPRGAEASIHNAAKQAGVPVSIHVRGALIYIRKLGLRTKRPEQSQSEIRCEVCGKLIKPNPGVRRQFVHAGKQGKKSECQKTRRYAVEHHVSIEEAIRHRRQWLRAQRRP